MAVRSFPYTVRDAPVWQRGLAKDGVMVGNLVFVRVVFFDVQGRLNEAHLGRRRRPQVGSSAADDLAKGLEVLSFSSVMLPVPAH